MCGNAVIGYHRYKAAGYHKKVHDRGVSRMPVDTGSILSRSTENLRRQWQLIKSVSRHLPDGEKGKGFPEQGDSTHWASVTKTLCRKWYRMEDMVCGQEVGEEKTPASKNGASDGLGLNWRQVLRLLLWGIGKREKGSEAGNLFHVFFKSEFGSAITLEKTQQSTMSRRQDASWDSDIRGDLEGGRPLHVSRLGVVPGLVKLKPSPDLYLRWLPWNAALRTKARVQKNSFVSALIVERLHCLGSQRTNTVEHPLIHLTILPALTLPQKIALTSFLPIFSIILCANTSRGMEWTLL